MTDEKRHFLDIFFNPRSVAVVGASRNMRTANYWLTGNLVNLKYPGKIYPVNPNATEIMGLKAYPGVRDIEGEIDLAAISVPAASVPGVIRDCIAKGVKSIAIIAGGFSETGANGAGIQDEVRRLLKESGIRAIGPNALSPGNSSLNFILGFSPVEKMPCGRLSFIFQSGLYQPRLSYLLNEMHINMNKLVDLGNKMDINEVDALEYYARDDSTEVIAMHLESIAGDGRKFFRLLKETTPKKPVIALKSGRTEAGAKAASSHTAAIIKATDTVMDVVLRQAGAIRVQGLDEFFDLAKIFEYYPPLSGNRIAVISFSGGEGVITTDFCQWHGLSLARPGEESRRKLSVTFPPWEIPLNPFDTGVATQFHPEIDVMSLLIDTLADDPEVDCLAIQIAGQAGRQPDGISSMPGVSEHPNSLVNSCLEARQKGKLVVLWLVDPRQGHGMIEQLEANRIPVYPSAERAVRALGALYRYNVIRQRG